jgi:ribosomal protein S18 acetylase RimI-like enzyme
VTTLAPMSADACVEYRETAISGYAEDNVASGRWPDDGALARSRADFDASLPEGLETPGNYLFEIMETERGPAVGFLWFAIQDKDGLRTAFVQDVEVKPEFQRRGHATAAFGELDLLVCGLGLSRIGLHVFRHNTAAQALHCKLEYRITGVNMLRELET